MKLYNSDISPYSTRIKLQIYLKGLKAEIINVSSGGSHTADYARMNPLEKVPTLDDGGFYLPESSVIGEYIEDIHPSPSLRPADPRERAKMRVIFAIADQYMLPPLFELFEQVNPATRNAKIVDEQLTELKKAFNGLEHFLVKGTYAMGLQPTLADCALVPNLFFIEAIGSAFGLAEMMGPKLKAYWATVKSDASVAKVLGELTVALNEYMKQNR